MTTTPSFAALIDNTVEIKTERYAAILGLAPSKGARSPLLWNAAFQEAGIDAEMLPLDVTEGNLSALLAALKADPRYIGGAVAVPHKQGLVPLLDRLEPEAERIGAVNAIWRDGDDLVGANTDGAGALSQLQEALGDLGRRRTLLVGLGGAGLAVAAYLAPEVGELALANRDRSKTEAAAARLGDDVKVAELPLSIATATNVDLLVNCTSVGMTGGAPGTAFDPTAEAVIAALPTQAFVYDIVYQPRETPLLKLARARHLRTLDGLGMNLDQAVIAFEKANPKALKREDLRSVMREAGRG